MAQLILSFFASIGVILLVVELCDFIIYRKYRLNSRLIIDLRNKNEADVIEVFEALSGIRRKRSGRAVLREIKIISEDNSEKTDYIRHYSKIFEIPITIVAVSKKH